MSSPSVGEQTKLTVTAETLTWVHALDDRAKLEEFIFANPHDYAAELQQRYQHPAHSQNWAPSYLLAHQVIVEALGKHSEEYGIEVAMVASLNKTQAFALNVAKLIRPWRQPVDGSEYKV